MQERPTITSHQSRNAISLNLLLSSSSMPFALINILARLCIVGESALRLGIGPLPPPLQLLLLVVVVMGEDVVGDNDGGS